MPPAPTVPDPHPVSEPKRSKSRGPVILVAVLVVVLVAAGLVWKFALDGNDAVPFTDVEKVFVQHDTPCTRSNARETREQALKEFERGLEGVTFQDSAERLQTIMKPLGDAMRSTPAHSMVSLYLCATAVTRTSDASFDGAMVGVYEDGGKELVFAVVIAEKSPLQADLEATGAKVVAVADESAAPSGAAAPIQNASVQICKNLRETIVIAMNAWKVTNGQYPTGPTWKDQIAGPDGSLAEDPTAEYPFTSDPAALRGVGKCAGM